MSGATAAEPVGGTGILRTTRTKLLAAGALAAAIVVFVVAELFVSLLTGRTRFDLPSSAVALGGILAVVAVEGREWLRRRSAPEVLPSIPLWRRPPGRTFHLAMAVAGAVLLVSVSVPGVVKQWLLRALIVLGFGAVVWCIRSAAYLVARLQQRSQGSAVWLVAAPLGLLMVATLWGTDLPLQARWTLSQGAFDDVVENRDGLDSGQDRVIGLYRITNVQEIGDAVVFSEANRQLAGSGAGFAYLPDGPRPDIVQALTLSSALPQFEHLGGPWYSWTRT
jgi:hypothetical protein